jgi:hypothetical protein
MRRGIIATLLLALTIGTAQAGAAPPATAAQPVVYELVRTSTAPVKALVTLYHDSQNRDSVLMYATLEPDVGGYRTGGAGVSASSGPGISSSRFEVDLSGGRRFLVGGFRGSVRVTAAARGWSVREAGRGFRVVSTDQGDLRTVGSATVEHFRRATAPGGPYGSVAYAMVPCFFGAGAWTFGNDAEPPQGPPRVCASIAAGSDSDSAGTRRGRTWTVDAQVVGVNGWPMDIPDVRLAVLDYPKRPAGR